MLYDTYWGLFPLHTFSLLHTTALSALVGVVMLLVWRLWKFSVVPALYPNDPKEFPYWMPCKINMIIRNSSSVDGLTFLTVLGINPSIFWTCRRVLR